MSGRPPRPYARRSSRQQQRSTGGGSFHEGTSTKGTPASGMQRRVMEAAGQVFGLGPPLPVADDGGQDGEARKIASTVRVVERHSRYVRVVIPAIVTIAVTIAGLVLYLFKDIALPLAFSGFITTAVGPLCEKMRSCMRQCSRRVRASAARGCCGRCCATGGCCAAGGADERHLPLCPVISAMVTVLLGLVSAAAVFTVFVTGFSNQGGAAFAGRLETYVDFINKYDDYMNPHPGGNSTGATAAPSVSPASAFSPGGVLLYLAGIPGVRQGIKMLMNADVLLALVKPAATWFGGFAADGVLVTFFTLYLLVSRGMELEAKERADELLNIDDAAVLESVRSCASNEEEDRGGTGEDRPRARAPAELPPRARPDHDGDDGDDDVGAQEGGDELEQPQGGNKLRWEVEAAMRDYIIQKIISSLFQAICSGTTYWLLDVPMWETFAVAHFCANWVQIIGPIICCVIPIPVVLVHCDCVTSVVIAFVIPVCVHLFVANVLEPVLMTDLLTPMMNLASLIFWFKLWHIGGLFLAIPMTKVVLMVLDARVGRTAFVQPFKRLAGSLAGSDAASEVSLSPQKPTPETKSPAPSPAPSPQRARGQQGGGYGATARRAPPAAAAGGPAG